MYAVPMTNPRAVVAQGRCKRHCCRCTGGRSSSFAGAVTITVDSNGCCIHAAVVGCRSIVRVSTCLLLLLLLRLLLHGGIVGCVIVTEVMGCACAIVW